MLLHHRLLRFLRRIEPPEYLHSSTRKRSHISNARVHVKQHFLMKADIFRFFESTTTAHLFAFFHLQLQMAEDLARLLARLCTRHGRLALGSPLSPVLSFWVHKTMFDRLETLSHQHGLRFTAYYDDLTFSGRRISSAFTREVQRIVGMQGLRLKARTLAVLPITPGVELTGALLRRGSIFVPRSVYRSAQQAIAAVPSPSAEGHLKAARSAEGYICAAAPLRPGASRSLKRQLSRVTRRSGVG